MKNKQEIFQALVTILEKEFEMQASDIQMHMNLYQELGLDSIDAVDLFVRLQELIGKKINPETFKRVRTVEDVVCAIDELISKA